MESDDQSFTQGIEGRSGSDEHKASSGRLRKSRLVAIGLAAGLVAGVGGGLLVTAQEEPAGAQFVSGAGQLPWDESGTGDATSDDDFGRGHVDERSGHRGLDDLRGRSGARGDLHGREEMMPMAGRALGRGRELLDVAAGELGIDVSVLIEELRAGKSIADVAAEKEVSVQDVIDGLVEHVTAEATERITDLVNRKSGTTKE